VIPGLGERKQENLEEIKSGYRLPSPPRQKDQRFSGRKNFRLISLQTPLAVTIAVLKNNLVNYCLDFWYICKVRDLSVAYRQVIG
jgi:hypothetical protein